MDSEEQETVKNVVFDRMKKSDIDNVKDEKMDESIEGSDGDEDEDAVDISDEEDFETNQMKSLMLKIRGIGLPRRVMSSAL